MFKRIFLISFLLFILSITAGLALTSDHTVLEYGIDSQNFAVIVVDDGLGYQQAKNIAMKKAAESARAKGYDYFKITSENKVQVIVGKKDWPSPYDFPQNLYQEEIIERGFNREKFYHQEETRGDTEAQDAYRFDIQCADDGLGAYRACDYMNC